MKPALLALSLAVIATAAAGCAPRAPSLTGEVVPARVPVAHLPPGYHKLVFDFTYRDPDGSIKGDGSLRLAAPDSVRLDFFVREEAVGDAVVIDDAVRAARPALARQLLPPTPFLWAALGLLRVPSAPDTAARVDGDTLRVEIGVHPAWRATFVDSDLLRLDLIDDGRIPQSVVRAPGRSLRFRDARAHRTLDITISRTDSVPAFDAAIWR